MTSGETLSGGDRSKPCTATGSPTLASDGYSSMGTTCTWRRRKSGHLWSLTPTRPWECREKRRATSPSQGASEGFEGSAVR